MGIRLIAASVIYTVLSALIVSCDHTDRQTRIPNHFSNELFKLEYNNPGLIVDLDAGFKVIPMPMDFDGDGDYDLLLSESGCFAESGVFYFENISGTCDMPVFRHGMKLSSERWRLSYDGSLFEVSVTETGVHVLTPDRVREKLLIYKNVPQNVFWDDNEVKLPQRGYDFLHAFKYTQWKIIDLDGDQIEDLICAAHSSRPSDLRGAGKKERDLALASIPGKDQFLFFKNSGSNDLPFYNNPVPLKTESGELLGHELQMKPLFADYDNDGDLDYIGIRYRDDKFLYFENTGTKLSYRFREGRVLAYNNSPLVMVSRATIHSTAIDWDRDGHVDIIAGDEDGKISFIKNSGKTIDGIPQFFPPKFFQQIARYVDFGALTAPRIFDWDDDGLDDIVSGNAVGNIGFIKNLGGYPPTWAAPQLLKAAGEEIRILPPDASWGYTTIDVADWNHDGLADIMVNHHHGNVLWYENRGSRKVPKLAAAKVVEVEWKEAVQKPEWVPGKTEGNELLAPWRTSPLIMDFNKDQLNDLVMLDYEGYLAVYPRYRGNDGTMQLAPPERNFIFSSGEPILLNQRKGSSSGRLKISFSDWDGDGLPDLIVSSKPAVDWMKNLGQKDGKMVLQYMGRVLSRTLMGHTDGPVTPDWNRDGIPDLLVGAENGLFYYWQRPAFDITTTMTSTGKQRAANYPYFKR